MADDFEELYSKLTDNPAPEISRNGDIRKPSICNKCNKEIKRIREKVTECESYKTCTEHVTLICGCPASKNYIIHINGALSH